MIPILYPKDATKTDTTTTNGRGSLLECIKCEVTEERNGIYELSMQYPITGSLFTEITEGALIKAKPNDKSTPQLFRIYKSGAPLKGIVTYSAEHISYDLTGLPIANLVTENTNAETAMQRALSLCPLPHSFNAYSDITTPNSTAVSKPTSIRAAFGGTAGGVLDTYGGEFEFDNYNVHLWKNRGANNGIILRYGKNITDINQERNIANCYTHIYPYAVKTTSEKAADGTTTEKEIVLTLPESVLPLINPADVGHTRVRIVDFSDDLDDKDDLDETTLRTLAKKYTEEAELHAPEINITLSFVNLAQTEDYKDMALLEAVGICDIINVYFEKLNITAHAKVIKTVYDALKEKLIKIEVGNAKANFVNTIKSFKRSIEKVKKVIGPQGKSAYDIWLANGNTGSEEDFLVSLKGDKGDTGKGIQKMEYDSAGNLVVTYTDGSTQTIEKPSTDDPDGGGDSGGNSGNSGSAGMPEYVETTPSTNANSGLAVSVPEKHKDYITGDIVIPEYNENEEITEIADNAFFDCKNITSVTIPNTVQYIGNHVFTGSGTTKIEILGMPFISEYAFENSGVSEIHFSNMSYETFLAHFNDTGWDWVYNLQDGTTLVFTDTYTTKEAIVNALS